MCGLASGDEEGRRTNQIRVGSPRRRPALSIPASATAKGSHNAPSSKLTESGRRCSQAAGCRWNLVKVPIIYCRLDIIVYCMDKSIHINGCLVY